ncbi:MFS transporter [Acuticoccus sp. M5D2P5]|uniref:MFS transporter n=1 Tax=Acuticoccus kalidii TaxID=2910977 RepID=UPI001F45D586|nr:MFS transporter [Acuticoccus kalidii]MCF3934257.1 MFS transporter [Acuticoccus kalidii]
MSSSRILAALAFIAFVSLGLPDGLLGVAWPSIRTDFTRPLDSLGTLVALTTIGYLVSSFMSGAVMRVLSIGLVLALSTGAAATALLGFAFAPAWPVLLACGLLAGLGGGAVDAALNAYAARHFDARSLNWMHAFYGVGATLGPIIVTAVLEMGLQWQRAYLVVGSAQLALAITFFLTRARWGAAPMTVAHQPKSERLVHTLSRPIVWAGMAVFFVYAGAEVATAQWSYSLLTLGRGVDETAAGLFVTLYWASLVAGRVLFGIVAHRIALVPALRVAIIGSIVGALLFWLEPTRTLSLVGLMTMGFLFAPVFASLISLTPARVGLAHADTAIGFQIAAAGLGAACLTGLVGIGAQAFGLGAIGVSIFLLTLVLWTAFELFMWRRPV